MTCTTACAIPLRFTPALPPELVLSDPTRLLYVPRLPLTEADLCDWIAAAKPGDTIQYHAGLLILDRSPRFSRHPNRERKRIDAVARRAWIACELGLVHLFSRSVGPGDYRYLAVRSRTPALADLLQARGREAQAVVGTPH